MHYHLSHRHPTCLVIYLVSDKWSEDRLDMFSNILGILKKPNSQFYPVLFLFFQFYPILFPLSQRDLNYLN